MTDTAPDWKEMAQFDTNQSGHVPFPLCSVQSLSHVQLFATP